MGLRILPNRLFHAGVASTSLIASTTHEAAFPAANLRLTDRKRYALASTATPGYQFDLGASQPLDTLVMVNTDLTPGAAVQIAASDVSGAGSELLSTAWLPVWSPLAGPGEGTPGDFLSGGYLDDAALADLFPAGVVLTVDFTQTRARYWRISFSEPSRAKPKIGVLYLCRRWEFVYQPNLGGLDSWTEDLSTIDYAEDGTAWVDRREAREVLELECTMPEGAAWWGGKDHFKKVGVGRPFVIDPVAKRPPSLGARAWSRIYGHFTALPRVESEGHLIWTVAMQITETL